MFKWIKRLFGLDYNDNSAAEKHSGVGYDGYPEPVENVEVVLPPPPEPEVPVAEEPVKVKKPRKVPVKKAPKPKKK